MKHILQFLFWKLKSADFWMLVAGSLAMYLGWQMRSNMRENIWRSYKQGPLGHKTYKGF